MNLFNEVSVRQKDANPSASRSMLWVVLTALALLWPALVNGGPFWFPDTGNYIRAADGGYVWLTGSPSEWSDRLITGEGGVIAAEAAGGGVELNKEELEPTRPVLTGRSIYYGFLLYLPMRLFGPWGAVMLQALLTSCILLWCAHIALRNSPAIRQAWLAGGLGALIFLTPLAYYTSMLMPDIYSGLLVLALATAMAFWRKIDRREQVALLVIAAGLATFHTTHILIAAGMGMLGFLLYLPRRTAWRPPLIALPVALAGVLSSIIFTFAVSEALETEPYSPPFLSARLTAAGPGTEFLARECATDPNAWELCDHQGQLSAWSDNFLWSEDPRNGVFQLASPDQQARMAAEDKTFFLSVLASDPVGLIGVSLESFAKQLVYFGMENFNYADTFVALAPDNYPPAVARSVLQSRAANDAMPTQFVTWASVLVTLASLTFVLAIFLRELMRGALGLNDTRWRYVALLLLGVLANAAICGALSGPHARYQMRLIWLVPFCALLVAAFSGWKRSLSAAPERL